MAGFDDLFKGDIVTALAIGVGAVILLPVAVRAAKPLAKMAIKGGLIVYEKGKETFHDVSEVVEDLVAEAKYELSTERGEPILAAAGGGTVAVSQAEAEEEKSVRPKPARKSGAKKKA